MARPARNMLDQETIPVPCAVKFPVELEPPEGFDPAEPATWPRVEGRLEWVGGRLLYMPPCGDLQQYTVSDVVAVLITWVRAHPEFVVGTNEAGMRLGEDTRGADAAVWRRADVGAPQGGFQRVPPVLAVEVAGRGESEAQLREKAAWYFAAGVAVVWLVLPKERAVVVMTPGDARRLGPGDLMPPHGALPDLAPPVGELFRQIAAPPG
jgi:Uma2 family endonuclease